MDSRSNNFDCVRLLAAFAVIYGHAFPLAMLNSPTLLGNSIQAFAVKIFFIVSGYLICKSWMNSPSFINYISKRVLRIFPALIVLVCLTIFIIGPMLTSLTLSEYYSNATVLYYVKNIALYPVYNLVDLFNYNSYKGAVNGSLWSLPVEFFMYLLISLVAVRRQVGSTSSTSCVLLIATAILIVMSLRLVHYATPEVHPVAYGTDLISALDVAPYFLIGALYSYYSLERFLNLGVALFLVGFTVLFQPASSLMQEIFLYVVAPYVILSFATTKTVFLHRMGRYGDFSYGIYLYGFLIQQIVNALTSNNVSPLQNALISMPLALLCACFSWHLIEKPALKYKASLNSIFIRGKQYE